MNQQRYDNPLLRRLYPLWRRVNKPELYDRMVADAINALRLKQGNSVLELACGFGYSIPKLAEAVGKNGKVTCIDSSEAMLTLARKTADDRKLPQVDIIRADAASIEYQEFFDGVLCVLGLSVIDDFELAIDQMYRALKPGGRLSIIDDRPYRGFPQSLLNIPQSLMFRIVGAKRRDIIGTLKNRFTEIETRQYLPDSKFLFVGKK